MKKVLLITTGGTISCVKTPQGLAPLLNGGNLLEYSDYKCDYLDFKLIDSSVMTDEDRMELSQLIWDKRAEYDSFVITHGTDSMAYTAAYLDCAFYAIDKTIILTGSQLPITFEINDAIGNLNLALKVAGEKNEPGVYIAFCGKVLPAKGVTKLETEDFVAFESVTKHLEEKQTIPDGTQPKLLTPLKKNVGIIHITPALSTEIILAYANMDAVLVLVLGAGGMPEKWVTALNKLQLLGVNVYIKSQCLYGNIESKYAAHAAAKEFPAINHTSIEYAVYSIMFGLV